MTYSEYLAHHGIEGMRWGKRNGPPYPLNASQMTSVEKAKNEVSEFATKEAIKRAKFKEKVKMTKLKEREQVRQNKAQEREERRQNRVDERESRRQNRVDEREMVRQNRVDEQELNKQNAFESKEKWEQYKRGRKYVRNFLIGAGVMTVAGLAVYKMVKTGKANSEELKKAAETVANRGNAANAAKSIRDVAKKTTGTKPEIIPPTSDKMKSMGDYVKKAAEKGVVGNKAKATSSILNVKRPTPESIKKAEAWIPTKLKEKTYASPEAVKIIEDYLTNKRPYQNVNPRIDLSTVLMDPKKWAYGR